MSQLVGQQLVPPIEPRRDRPDRNAERLRNLVVRQTLDILEQDWQSQFWSQFRDCALNRNGHLAPVIPFFLQAPPCHVSYLDFGAERHKPSSPSVLVRASVCHYAIQPSREL